MDERDPSPALAGGEAAGGAGGDSRRLRLLFRTGDVDRQFCWFAQRGDDLYWGSSRGEAIEGASAEIHEDGMGMTL